MKKIIVIMLLMVAWSYAGAQTRVIYTCPMHPQIKMEKPGNCPICGMTLVKKIIRNAPPKAVPQKQVPQKYSPPLKGIRRKMRWAGTP
jgi:hypothetical protein